MNKSLKNKILYIAAAVLIIAAAICLFISHDRKTQTGPYVSIYLTIEDDVDYINMQKKNSSSGSAEIYNEKNELLYSGGLKSIKGRGNTSWSWAHEMKPYNIKLDEKAELIENGGASKKWCLLSGDMYDELGKEQCFRENPMFVSMLAYSLFQDLGGSNPLQCIPAELYINDEYRGCYLLSEAVQIGEGRVEISDGGVVLELDNTEGREKDDVQFTTSHGNRFLFKDPDEPSEEMYASISEYIQDFEDALYAGSGHNSKGLYYTEYCDLDAFATEMAVRLLCTDVDIYRRSEFWSIDVDSDGQLQKIKPGPVWDFDACWYGIRDFMSVVTQERLDKRGCMMELFRKSEFTEKFVEIVSGKAREVVTSYAKRGSKIEDLIYQYADIKKHSFERWPEGTDYNAGKKVPYSARCTFNNYRGWVKYFYKEIWDTGVLLEFITPVYEMNN